ncbi:hypothetical protein GCM10010517_67110 [Streptosporangium fragile]|uniref:Uncharacterized protein n=1 Tax=Streptosporangium fragile TaxID=46186 RepID=A0ABN3W9C6_9ACTN
MPAGRARRRKPADAPDPSLPLAAPSASGGGPAAAAVRNRCSRAARVPPRPPHAAAEVPLSREPADGNRVAPWPPRSDRERQQMTTALTTDRRNGPGGSR